MKRAVVFTALGGFALTSLSLGLQYFSPAQSAELEGFAINTQDKAVTVTLFTDQRVPFTTEQQGKQYAIVLPNTQLSAQQINNGLPVVIDNKNRFIGRAVPTEDGKVKIILPNLPASEYAVSIQQKRPGQTIAVAEPSPSVKPRPAVTIPASNRFEQVVSQYTKPIRSSNESKTSSLSHNKADEAPLKLSPSPNQAMSFQTSSGGAIWNPYVVKTPAVPSPGNTAYSKYHPVPRTMRKAASSTNNSQPINTEVANNAASLADTLNSAANNIYNPPSSFSGPAQTAHANNTPDPLWYLHSLPPAKDLPTDNLTGPALQDNPLMLSPAPAAQTKPAEPAPRRSISSGIKEAFSSIPKWLLITLGIFLGGIGIFALIGGLVLLRILFSQTRQQFSPQPMLAYHPMYAPPLEQVSGSPQAIEKSPYSSRPNALPIVAFKDTACFSALDYLKESPGNIRQAVHNTVLVKFPSRKRHRSNSKKRVNQSVGNTAALYSYHP